VEADPADPLPAIDDCHALAELGARDRTLLPGGTGADHDQVVSVIVIHGWQGCPDSRKSGSRRCVDRAKGSVPSRTSQRAKDNSVVTGLPDYHVHTFRCGHAGGKSRDFIRRAIERGLSEMAFTDHIPLYFLPEAERDPKLAMREDQFDDYLNEVDVLRRQFASVIPVRLGLEADYAQGYEE